MITCIYDYIFKKKCVKCMVFMHKIACYHLPYLMIRVLGNQTLDFFFTKPSGRRIISKHNVGQLAMGSNDQYFDKLYGIV